MPDVKTTPLQEHAGLVADLDELWLDAEIDTTESNALVALTAVLKAHEPVPGKPKYADDPRRCCTGVWWRECPTVLAIKTFVDKEFLDA